MCYRFPIGIKLSKCFLKLLTSRQPDLSDFEEVDPQVSSSLQAIASASEQELETMQLTFEPPTGTAFPIDDGKKLHNSTSVDHCTLAMCKLPT